MRNYEKIDFSKVENAENYLLEKIKEGNVFIVIAIDESENCIDDLTSYANTEDNKNSWFSRYLSDGQKLKDFIISQNMTPSYDEKEKTVDIDYESQNIYTFEEFKREIKDMEDCFSGKSICLSGEDDEKFHYEFYISLEKCDIENFAANLECEFCEEWISDNGWKK